MAQQMISERAFSPEAIAELGGTPTAARHMTVAGTVFKSLVLFAVTCGFAVFGWDHAPGVIKATSGPSWLLGYFLLIALSFLAIARPRLSPLGGLVYAVLMGLWLGGISRVYEAAYDGIVAQALLATMATVLVCLVLYALRIVKVSRRFVLVVVAATFGIALMYLTAWILTLFGTRLTFWTSPSPAGIAISVVICVVAALNLFVDFAYIDAGVAGGAPTFMEWYSAWGLLATVVWLYIEVLYLLARLRNG
ncbi:MAG TPA: Bax inhibitor-1/YccA family protein [Actinomycetota bacterium]|nr:Bax inhibitor-1/YccA family protein [Actinomycetota bacterium]